MSPRERMPGSFSPELPGSTEKRRSNTETTGAESVELLPLDSTDYRINQTRAVIDRLDKISTSELNGAELKRELGKIIDFEYQALLEAYHSDFGTKTDESTLEAAGYRTEELSERLSPHELCVFFKQLHDEGADFALLDDARTIAIKRPVTAQEFDGITDRATVMDFILDKSPWERRSMLEDLVVEFGYIEFDVRGRIAILERK